MESHEFDPKVILDLWNQVDAQILEIRNTALDAERLLVDLLDRIPAQTKINFLNKEFLSIVNWPRTMNVAVLFDMRRPTRVVRIDGDEVIVDFDKITLAIRFET